MDKIEENLNKLEDITKELKENYNTLMEEKYNDLSSRVNVLIGLVETDLAHEKGSTKELNANCIHVIKHLNRLEIAIEEICDSETVQKIKERKNELV